MMFKIKCPSCQADTSLSMVQPSYRGSYRCWKCKALFTIEVENNALKSCKPLSQEDFDREQAEKLKSRFRQM